MPRKGFRKRQQLRRCGIETVLKEEYGSKREKNKSFEISTQPTIFLKTEVLGQEEVLIQLKRKGKTASALGQKGIHLSSGSGYRPVTYKF